MDSDSDTKPVVAPYVISYELKKKLDATPRIRSHGRFELNSFPDHDVLSVSFAEESLGRTNSRPDPENGR